MYPLHSIRCCSTLWMAGCCQPTVPMNGRWVSSLCPGAPVASSLQLAAMMKKYG